MLIYSTYCSAGKKATNSPIPAVELYSSKRIAYVNELAHQNNTEFFILSGKFGLIHSKENINYYDHLLMPEEVETHAQLVTEQLKKNEISKIIFYTNSLERDCNIQPYLDCIRIAANEAGVLIEFVEEDYQD